MPRSRPSSVNARACSKMDFTLLKSASAAVGPACGPGSLDACSSTASRRSSKLAAVPSGDAANAATIRSGRSHSARRLVGSRSPRRRSCRSMSTADADAGGCHGPAGTSRARPAVSPLAP